MRCGWVAAFSPVTQEENALGGQTGEKSIFSRVDADRKIPDALVLGNLC